MNQNNMGKDTDFYLLRDCLASFLEGVCMGGAQADYFSRLETLSAESASLMGSVPPLQISAALVSYRGPPIFCLGWK